MCVRPYVPERERQKHWRRWMLWRRWSRDLQKWERTYQRTSEPLCRCAFREEGTPEWCKCSLCADPCRLEEWLDESISLYQMSMKSKAQCQWGKLASVLVNGFCSVSRPVVQFYVNPNPLSMPFHSTHWLPNPSHVFLPSAPFMHPLHLLGNCTRIDMRTSNWTWL